MKIIFRIILLVAPCCLFLGYVAAGKTEDKTTEMKRYVLAWPSFDSVAVDVADKSVNHSVKSYYDAEKNLMKQLRDSKTDSGKMYAIYLLGEFRAAHAVWDLLKIIDFKAKWVDPKSKIGRWGTYPASEALVKIGSPSVTPVVRALAQEDAPLRRKLMVMVLIDVLGDEFAEYRLQATVEKAKADEKRRYMKAIALLKSWRKN